LRFAQWWGRGNKPVIECLEVERGGDWRFVEHAPDGVRGMEEGVNQSCAALDGVLAKL